MTPATTAVPTVSFARRRLSDIRAEYYFDRKAARSVIIFFQKELRHVEGELVGKRVHLQPWQRRILRRFFGWRRRADGLRKYRVLYLEVPRKNGKSLLGAGIAIYLLVADKEPGAKVVSAAADREQAALVYDVAKKMVDFNRRLSAMLKPYLRTMVTHDRLCKYEVVSAEVRTKHGKNLHGVIFDELHAQPDRHLVDVLKTSMGARRQPVEIYLTTAGDNKNTVCYEYHKKALNVLKGIVEDESFLPFIYSADDKDDWKDRRTWDKANPNLGVSIKRDYIEQQFQDALLSPSYENTFKRLHLNIWTEQETRWLPVERWEECEDRDFDYDSLAGRECYAGLDLGYSQDVTALVLAFPELQGEELWVTILQWLFVPEESIVLRAKRDQIDYAAWVNHGWLRATPGNVTDYVMVREQIQTLAERYDIREIGIDRANALEIGTQLSKDDGMNVVMLSQNFATLSSPTKRLEDLILGHRLRHEGNPVMRWMFSNIATVTDSDKRIRFSKKKAREKIDGMSALVNALSRLILRTDGGDSVYNGRGIVLI